MAEIGLAMVRNALSHGVFREPERRTLESIQQDLETSGTPYAALMLDVIAFAQAAVARGEMEVAYHEINFIHNLPESAAAADGWNDDWFYQFNLFGYLEESNDATRIKRVLRMLADAESRRRGRMEAGERDIATYRGFLHDVGIQLKEAALEAKSEAAEKPAGPERDFSLGVMLGWHNALSTLQSTARSFEIPLEELNLEGLDPTRDLLL